MASSHIASEAVTLDAPHNLLPPDALQSGRINTKADIWMLGCTAYLRLNGAPPFASEPTDSPVEYIEQTLSKLEYLLASSGKLSEEDIPLTASFLRSCLVLDPVERPSAPDLMIIGTDWVMREATCSCGWCATEV
ncbi:hypothetical protein BDZ97DRAFT_1119105 [Flammula alnicola]|nr:hypothetical protein BDZ97DRAFT_1119105 [Flammula alnicola]